MIEQKKRVICDTTYMVTQMDAFRALSIQTKLFKILGPAVPLLFSGQMDADNMSAILSMIPEVAGNFDHDFVDKFIISLFEQGVFKQDKNGHPESIDFGIEFAGKSKEMWQVALFILEVNFFGGKSIMSSLLTTHQPE